jgi:hypothetical protein
LRPNRTPTGGLLAASKNRLGAPLNYLRLLLSPTTADILLFYFEQLSTSLTTAIQFLVLIGVFIYRRRQS